MITCPTCGALNDPVNRFCDQCGSRLEPSGSFPQASAPTFQAPPAATVQTCPDCGATVFPGQAFCEECGTALTAVRLLRQWRLLQQRRSVWMHQP